MDADGTLFTNVHRDEAGGNVQQYRDGQLIAMARHTHGWGYEGGEAVGRQLPLLVHRAEHRERRRRAPRASWPPKGLIWSGVLRAARSDITRAAHSPAGHGKEGDVLQGAFLPVTEFAEHGQGRVGGLWATEKELFVSNPVGGRSRSTIPKTCGSFALGRSSGRFGYASIARPGVGSAKAEGWRKRTGRQPMGRGRPLLHVRQGATHPEAIEFPAGVIPTAWPLTPATACWLPMRGRTSKSRCTTGSTLTPSFNGTLGRVAAFRPPVPGKFGDLRFNRPAGCWRGWPGQRLRRLQRRHCRRQHGLGMLLVHGPMPLAAAGPGVRRYGRLDPHPSATCTPRKSILAWIGASLRPGVVLPGLHRQSAQVPGRSAAAPVDNPRLAAAALRAGFLFVSDMTGEFLHIYRFSPAERRRNRHPLALLSKRHIPGKDGYPPHQPEKGQWLWHDLNADGRIDAGEYQSSGKEPAAFRFPMAGATSGISMATGVLPALARRRCAGRAHLAPRQSPRDALAGRAGRGSPRPISARCGRNAPRRQSEAGAQPALEADGAGVGLLRPLDQRRATRAPANRVAL